MLRRPHLYRSLYMAVVGHNHPFHLVTSSFYYLLLTLTQHTTVRYMKREFHFYGYDIGMHLQPS